MWGGVANLASKGTMCGEIKNSQKEKEEDDWMAFQCLGEEIENGAIIQV